MARPLSEAGRRGGVGPIVVPPFTPSPSPLPNSIDFSPARSTASSRGRRRRRQRRRQGRRAAGGDDDDGDTDINANSCYRRRQRRQELLRELQRLQQDDIERSRGRQIAGVVNITGYNFVSNHRKSKTGGGVGIYLQNGLECKLLEECKFSDPHVIESLFFEIIVPHGKISLLVACTDHQIKKTAMFIDKFNNIVSIISKDNKHCYVMGDFNLDLLQVT